MRLSALTEELAKRKLAFSVCGREADPELELLVSDSRKAAPDTIFACVPGLHSDGGSFAAAAVKAGCRALLCGEELDVPVPQIVCRDPRAVMGLAAAILYGEPAQKLIMTAVTGTNGKTTSVFMLRSMLEKAGVKTGMLSTVFCFDGETTERSEHTTPEGSDLQLWLRRMAAGGCRACVMEASSHSVAQGRLEGSLFDRAGFTNLTTDHLDYHKDSESYFQAKRKLFTTYMKEGWRGSANLDDPYGARLCEEFSSCLCGYSIAKEAPFSGTILGSALDGLRAKVKTPWSAEPCEFTLPLIGAYNLENALQALSLAWTLGLGREEALAGLLATPQVPGRLERYRLPGGGVCVIDFAHNPDGLRKALTAVRPLCRGQLRVVFGAGGESDRSKRPLMGETAAAIADEILITSDNPKSEDPRDIAAAIEAGAIKQQARRRIIIDREEAICQGLALTGKDDVLVLAGKGPEQSQILKDGPVPFNDCEVMKKWRRENGGEVL